MYEGVKGTSQKRAVANTRPTVNVASLIPGSQKLQTKATAKNPYHGQSYGAGVLAYGRSSVASLIPGSQNQRIAGPYHGHTPGPLAFLRTGPVAIKPTTVHPTATGTKPKPVAAPKPPPAKTGQSQTPRTLTTGTGAKTPVGGYGGGTSTGPGPTGGGGVSGSSNPAPSILGGIGPLFEILLIAALAYLAFRFLNHKAGGEGAKGRARK